MSQTNYVGRLYDSIRSMLDDAVLQVPDRDAYQFRKGHSDEIIHVTFREFNEITENLGAALTRLGFGSSHIACMGENSFKWICVYLTVLKSAGVFVPIDKELPSQDKLHVLSDSESEVLFFSGKYLDWVRENFEVLQKTIKLFVCLDLEEDDPSGIRSFQKLVEEGSTLSRQDYDALKSDDHALKLLVYTSGTTGIAKGVMLTEHNIRYMLYYGLEIAKIYDKGLSVLPYHHTYEAVADILGSLQHHSTLCINASLKDIVKDLRLFQPSYIFIVPALGEFMLSSIQKNIRQQGKEAYFNRAVSLSKNLRKAGIDIRSRLFKSLRDVFGGRMRIIICGGAPIREELGQFFDAIGIYLIGGYGITECSPLVCVNTEEDLTYNTVGHRLGCVEWYIENPNEEGIGEICIKGDTVMKGYFGNVEATEEALRGGWFHTGDYGYIDSKDRLVITGRKKNIIVLNNGKNIYPEEIEGYIQGLECVSEVIVRGLKNERNEETSLLAEVYPAIEIGEEELLAKIQNTLVDLPKYKMVTKVLVRSEPFPKTSSNKIKR